MKKPGVYLNIITEEGVYGDLSIICGVVTSDQVFRYHHLAPKDTPKWAQEVIVGDIFRVIAREILNYYKVR